MKNILIICFTLFYSAISFAESCDKYFSGQDMDQIYRLGDEISITDQVGDMLLLHDTFLETGKLSVEVEEISGFLCVVQLKKVTNQCLVMRVIWDPGYDINGCFIQLFDSSGNFLGITSIFINY